MNTPADEPRANLRRSVYVLTIVAGTGIMLGRILAVDSVNSQALEKYR